MLILLVIPVSLGTQSSFRRLYNEPIVRGQQPDANNEEKLLGQTRAAEVTNRTPSRLEIPLHLEVPLHLEIPLHLETKSKSSTNSNFFLVKKLVM